MPGIAGSSSQADASRRAFGKAIAELFPGASAIDRAEDATGSSAALQHPGMAHESPQPRKEDQRILWIDDERADAGCVVHKQGLLPGFSAVSRTKDAALRIRPPDVSQNTNQNDAGIVRIN